MSALAKVFVVLVVFLSVGFFGTTSTLFLMQKDLKAEISTKEDAFKELEDDLKATIARQKEAINKQREAIVQLREHDKDLANQLASARQMLANETTRANRAEASRDAAVRNSTACQEEKTQKEQRLLALERQRDDAIQRRDAAVASEEAAIKQRNRMARDLELANKELQDQKIAFADLSNKYEELELRWQAVEPHVASAVPAEVAPPLDAVIEAVRPDLGAVVLSVGRDQDVKVGHEFVIYRGETYVGKVKVRKLYRDLSGASVLYEKEGEQIRVGDRATTRIGTLSS